MNWAYGITTVASRGATLLKTTVDSLANAGFDRPVLFVDGMDPEWKPPSESLSGVILHEPAAGHLGNWITGLTHLYTVFPDAERYAMFEDDLIAVKNLRTYLEQSSYPDKGYWNLLTHAENLVLTGGRDGWHKSNQLGRGAVGLVFDRATAGILLRLTGVTERPRLEQLKPHPRPAVDAMVIDALKPLGYVEHIHCPTLLQHTGGDHSVLGHHHPSRVVLPNGTIGTIPSQYCREVPGWRGEDFNVLTLLEVSKGDGQNGNGKANVDLKTLESLALEKMIPPSKPRPTVWRGGVIQIHVTRACDMACCHCTQGSNLGGKPATISPEDFELACHSLRDYWGIVGMFGGNPAVHPQFEELCDISAKHIPFERRGLWCNHPRGHGKKMRETFNPAVSNLNVHLNREAYEEFKRDWPECHPFGLDVDSRHSPPFVAMLDVVPDEAERWKLIGDCDINRYWSAMVASVPGKGLRGFFCEIAGAQAILHANDPDWPDTGIPVSWEDEPQWWQWPMQEFADQVRWNCHRCGVPLRRNGELAQGGNLEEISKTHADVAKPKVRDRQVELVQLDSGPKLNRFTDYLQNAK